VALQITAKRAKILEQFGNKRQFSAFFHIQGQASFRGINKPVLWQTCAKLYSLRGEK